jgi:uncharacterized protein with PIN domain
VLTAGGGPYDAAQRRALQAALRAGTAPRCPYCGVPLTQQRVEPGAEVAYVRRRVWVLCPECRRTASLDAPP